MILSVASTMVAVKLLVERGEAQTPHARLTVATLLAEDLIVIGLIVFLPVLGGAGGAPLASLGVALLRAVLVLVPFFYLANRAVPRLLERVARRNNTELFLLVAIAIGIGTAGISNALGLSVALGAFLAGLIISESEFTHEILARLLPLRDVFVALFFVSIGMLIRPRDLLADLPSVLIILALILAGKFAVRTLVLRTFGYPLAMATLVSVHLAQAGEFTFVLAQVGRVVGVLSESLYHAILAASLISIVVTALLSRLAHRLIEEPIPSGPTQPGPAPGIAGHVLICGFGRVGGVIGEALRAVGVSYAVIDLDFRVVERLRGEGIPCVYGDAASEPVLRHVGAERARLAVVAIPDFQKARLVVRRLKEINHEVPVLVRSHHLGDRLALAEDGAAEVIQPEFEAAVTLTRHVLERLGMPWDESKERLHTLPHWDPHTALLEPPPYAIAEKPSDQRER
jgi:CPA2 family monovalent cation:H+ antiporter-2